jgi:cell division protein FtsI/penicillin-binding protein 2
VLPDCAYPDSGWFCPSSTKSFSATNKGSSGSPRGAVSFKIGYYDSLTASSNNVFAEIGGDGAGEFDWGLPFYFGRNVYVGLEGTESSLGSGLYWAY